MATPLPHRPLTWRRLERHLTGYLFAGPAVVVFCAFVIYPIFYSIWLSFHEWNGYDAAWGPFVGLENYLTLLQEEVFWKAIINSTIFVIARTPLEVGIGLALALLLNRSIPGRNLLRTLFFVPVVMSLIVVTLIFQRILEPTMGVLNTFLRAIGLGVLAFPWLGDPATALAGVILVSVWKNVGFSMVILLAGLQGLSRDVIEAARVDGADGGQVIWRIVIPLMRPIMAMTALLSIISGLKVFDLIFILTRGGPTYSTEVLATLLYRQAFELNDMGLASAVAVVMVAIVMGTAAVQFAVLSGND